ncbi:DNA sulfur modification protein DndB [Bacillus cereus]|nr:DNA sulfur modification protein DndB [Bacillus cereus]MEB9555124.1 DNA sulfur modification protein DndB [Bacillus cereus]
MLNQINLDATKFEWQNKTCYVGNIKYVHIPSTIDLKDDLSMNREINENRVQDILDYLKDRIEGTFFPPVILSSDATLRFNESTCTLSVIDGSFTVIDGQHRISAIKNLMDDVPLDKKYKNMRLPVLIIEGLENYQHRNLFNTINKKAKIVDNNISIRFSPILENLIGLRYFSENPLRKPLIEWEKKQSFAKDQVAYIHLTECIKELNKALKNTQILTVYRETNDERLLYTNTPYYNIFECLLNKLFDHIQNNQQHLQFHTTKAYLRALTDEICDTVIGTANLDSYLKLGQLIDGTADDLLKPITIKYKSKVKSTPASYRSIRVFLQINSFLSLHKDKLNNILDIIERYLDSYYAIGDVLDMSEDDITQFKQFVLDSIDQLTSLPEDFDIESINFNKELTVESLIDQLTRGEQTVE